MRLDGGGVDQQFSRRPASGRQGVKHIGPYAFGSPALEPIIERLARTVDRWCVLPPATRHQDMHDAADHPAIIHARLASCIGRKMRLKPCVLRVSEPEVPLIHKRSPFGDLESNLAAEGNPVYGSQP